MLGLGGPGVAAGSGVQQFAERVEVLGVLGLEPPAVVLDGSTLERGDVRRLDRVVEPPPRAGVIAPPPEVLLPAALHVERRLEVRLADEGRVIAGRLEVGGDARRVGRECDAVGDHAVGAGVLPGEHRAPRRHTDGVVVVRALVVDAVTRQGVGDRCAGNRAAVAPERVEALLVGRHEENIASHMSSLAGESITSERYCQYLLTV